MGSENLKSTFVSCAKCGKRLIEMRRDGIWHFLFGKPKEETAFVPVDMYIQGNVKIKCLRRGCGHWNILNYLPSAFQSDETPNSPTVGPQKMKNNVKDKEV